MKKSEIMQIIKEAVQVVLTNEEAIEIFDLDPAALLDEMMKVSTDDLYLAEIAPTHSGDVPSYRSDDDPRTAKGNITQDTRKKHATVGKDKFPIFDKKSAEAAIDLRGHAPEADRARIIDKAAEYAPEAAKKAREADKKKKKG
tara:strand:+ start:486 stop:914 length:429 start_codon:yes stop_codon:yes gene_type:complete